MKLMKYRAMIIPALLGACLLAAPATLRGQAKVEPQDPQKPDVIKVETALVTVPVIVTDRYSRFVTGLGRSDFKVHEDGKPQDIVDFDSVEEPFNVALLIDTSRSTIKKLGEIKKAALRFVNQLQPSDRVLIVAFDQDVRFVGDFSGDRAQLKRGIDSLKTGFTTSLYDAVFRTVTEKLSPLQGRKAIVLLTDGVDTGSRQGTLEGTLEMVGSAGVISYTIQFETRNVGGSVIKPGDLPPLSSKFSASLAPQGPPPGPAPARDRYLVGTEYLRALAGTSGARYIRSETIENANYAFALIAEELRHQYTITYSSTNASRDGNFRKIHVDLGREDLIVRARQGYRAPKD